MLPVGLGAAPEKNGWWHAYGALRREALLPGRPRDSQLTIVRTEGGESADEAFVTFRATYVERKQGKDAVRARPPHCACRRTSCPHRAYRPTSCPHCSTVVAPPACTGYACSAACSGLLFSPIWACVSSLGIAIRWR